MAGKSGQAKITKTLFKKHLPNSSCSYTQLSKLLGCHRYTLRSWLRKHPDMQELFDKQKEYMIGECEDVLYEAVVKNRDAKVSQWYLSRMTNKYTDKSKVEHTGDLSIEIKIVDAKNKDDE